MNKTEFIRARVEPGLKASAGRVLKRVGISTTDAITMFLHQVVMHGGLPFEARIPNKETKAAIAELEAGKGERLSGPTSEAFDRIAGVRKRRKA